MLSLLPLILTAAGAYMLFRLRCFFILHPLRTAGKTLASVKNVDTAKSVTLALAGTLGVGNVFGVCLGIIVGGSGSVLWLLVSSIFASVLKYSEVTLSHDNLEHTPSGTSGGMIYTLRGLGGRLGTPLSYIYAAFCLLLALFMGSALQCGTVAEAFGEIFDTPQLFIGIIFGLAVFVSIVGGVKIIEKITLVAIPLSTILYIIITASVIAIHAERLPEVVRDIFSSALRPESGVGGILGFLLSPAIREGYSRGLLSNEAGCGTSSFAHTRSGILNPAAAGLMGIVEVVFDTVILCSLTAFAVLTAVPRPEEFSNGMSLILTAVGSTLGDGFELVLLALVALFAYATVVCWYYYGSVAFRYLSHFRREFLFLPLYLVFVPLGAVLDNRLLVYLTDCSMLALATLTVTALIKKSDRVVALSEIGGVLPRRRLIRNESLRVRERRAERASRKSHSPSSPR